MIIPAFTGQVMAYGVSGITLEPLYTLYRYETCIYMNGGYTQIKRLTSNSHTFRDI